MFTGIVQQLGTLVSREAAGGDARLVVEVPAMTVDSARIGDSVAVNGVCLTVAGIDEGRLQFDVSAETLSRTRLGELPQGCSLNLEPALSASDPVGGHFVTGHVDGIGEVLSVDPDGRSRRMKIEAPDRLARYIAVKGCITVDGVSLTVNEVSDNRFDVNIVPHTWSATNMKDYVPGTRVNLEVDLIARYLERLLADREGAPSEPDITADYLSRQGFAAPMSDADEEEYEDWQESRSDRSD
ncbi:MAG TPA: riboflavin synthase [Arenicellales bacterium]|nr:riboflavin synthase [Arenicellales bacterium]